ncbi:hypothetical protein [Bacillus toyonensis]|uniref:hypothetical protein n=1 Tax=Bacillus toyonensis TaxID=155322 RepID=UPI002E204D17|nr:hypothetical protein [Bacillus toyonensis]
MEQYKLCYIAYDYWAYFTTLPLEDQEGEKWYRSPYHCNAGVPVKYDEKKHEKPYKILKVAFESNHYPPCEFSQSYSVEDINNKNIPWLSRPPECRKSVDDFPHIYAGESLEGFIKKIKSSGGEVYLKVE